LTNTKRLGRYHHPSNNNNDNSTSPLYSNDLASLYKNNNRKPLFDRDKPLFGQERTSLHKVLADAKKRIERSTKFINKIKSRQLAYDNRAKSIPENATIRKEYIKCKKANCYHDQHGPYYYAYWKDPESKKLKKKYIGDHMHNDKRSNNNSNSNQVL
jgi:hypothetical protein